MRSIIVLLAIALSAATAQADDLPTFDIRAKKPADTIKVKVEKDTTIFDIVSPSGIGGGTIKPTHGNWPTTIILRLHLSGLESFAATAGKMKLTGSVLSHSGNTKRLTLTEDGEDSSREPGTEIKVLDADGKAVKGLPGKNGYFEIRLPKALLQDNPKSLELGWIDFFRG
jgi:hypothetical protein